MPETVQTAEGEEVQVQQLNQQLLQAIEGAETGHLKNASSASSQMIRRQIRENGFWRNILKLTPITNSDLTRSLETDLPRIIEDMEPDSPGAKSIAFNDGPDTAFYRGDRFGLWKRLAPGIVALACTVDGKRIVQYRPKRVDR